MYVLYFLLVEICTSRVICSSVNPSLLAFSFKVTNIELPSALAGGFFRTATSSFTRKSTQLMAHSTAEKSILNFIQLSSLVAKYCKMWKIQSCKVCEFCILLYYARKSVTAMWKCGNAFSRVTQKCTKFANFTLLYFRLFTTKLHNFTKCRTLFSTVLKSFTNLKAFLIREWSITSGIISAMPAA